MTDVLAKQEQINDPAGGKRVFCPLNTVIKKYDCIRWPSNDKTTDSDYNTFSNRMNVLYLKSMRNIYFVEFFVPFQFSFD
jgi:hypothetical protein